MLELKNNASKLLLAIMESRGDSENAERILYNMNPRQLIEVACRAYHQEDAIEEDDDDGDPDDNSVSPKEVGHNIYILCHQLAQHNKDLAHLLRPLETSNVDEKTLKALSFYAKHTAQIEIVRNDRTLEQIVFPIPEICEYLTHDTKVKVLNTAELDDQGSKVKLFIFLAFNLNFIHAVPIHDAICSNIHQLCLLPCAILHDSVIPYILKLLLDIEMLVEH